MFCIEEKILQDKLTVLQIKNVEMFSSYCHMMCFECGHGDGNLGLSDTLILKAKTITYCSKRFPKS